MERGEDVGGREGSEAVRSILKKAVSDMVDCAWEEVGSAGGKIGAGAFFGA